MVLLNTIEETCSFEPGVPLCYMYHTDADICTYIVFKYIDK